MKNLPRRRFFQLFTAILFCGIISLGSGCRTSPDDIDWTKEAVPSIYIEAANSTPASAKTRITMPSSGLQFEVLNSPLVPGGNFLDVDVGYAGAESDRGPIILARLDDRGARAIYHQSMKARGQRLILVIQDKPVGVHPITAPVSTGDLFFHAEIESTSATDLDAKLQKLRTDTRSTILKIREYKEETK